MGTVPPASGSAESELVEASNAIQRDFLDGRRDCLRRELARSADGLSSDVVQWSDAAAAAGGLEAAGSSATCHRYFHLMAGANGNPDPGEGVILMRLVRAYPRDAIR